MVWEAKRLLVSKWRDPALQPRFRVTQLLILRRVAGSQRPDRPLTPPAAVCGTEFPHLPVSVRSPCSTAPGSLSLGFVQGIGVNSGHAKLKGVNLEHKLTYFARSNLTPFPYMYI